MNGCTFKAVIVSFAILSALFLTPLTNAMNCMSCHQGEQMQADKLSQTNHTNPQQHKKKQHN
ncbi:MAG: hypothetical protein V4501_10015 [Pseudomonadota bacterium]